jgi:hypothetical protein
VCLPLKLKEDKMEAIIMDGWSFMTDEQQYILVHTYMKERIDFKTRKGTGEMFEKREEVGYFRTVTAMLRRLAEILVRDKMAEGQIQTIRDYIRELERIEKKLREMCKGY